MGVKKTLRKKSVAKEVKVNIEIIAILLIAFGLLLSVFYYLNSTSVFIITLKSVTLGLFGVSTYVIPVVLFIIGLHLLIKRNYEKYKIKYYISLFFPIIIGAIIHLFSVPTFNTDGIKQLYAMGVENVGGGVVGGIIAEPVSGVISFWGSAIVFLTIFFIMLIIVFDISVYSILKSIYNLFLKLFTVEQEDEVKPKIDKEKREKEFKVIENMIKGSDNKSAQEIEPTVKIYGIDDDADKKKLKEEKPILAVEQLSIIPKNEHIEYVYPTVDLLEENPSKGQETTVSDLKTNAQKLVDTLKSFGVEAKVLNIERGPTVTRYELQPNVGVKVSKITNLSDDIALNLAARGVRIEAPIPGKAAVGIEIPNKTVTTVFLKDVIDTDEFKTCPSKIAFALGKDIAGKTVLADIAKMPHLLIAGATGSGKSVCINTLISSILFKSNPNEVKLLMIDPKVVELGVYNGIPHLLIPVVTDCKKAAGALSWAVSEMVNRYKLFAENNVRDLRGYNQIMLESEQTENILPQIVIIIDELADLMMVAPNEVEDSICRLAQLARAAGMHLVIATQRPSVDVITGIIKANIPSRISFAVSSQVDSRTILDMAGAEKLLGKGDMLYFPIGEIKPIRLQGAFVTDKEVEKIVNHIKEKSKAEYNDDIIEKIEKDNEYEKEDAGDADELLPKAIELVVDKGEASVSMLQRRFKVGYSRAARIVDQMEERGIVGGYEGSKPRKVLISRQQYLEMIMSSENN